MSRRCEFGHPAVFADHVDQSKWVSFTATLHQPTLFRLVRECTGNVPGEGGLIGQPENVSLLWGYGLSVDRPGDFVKKPMSPCSGREIMTEVLGHLRIAAVAASILDTCILHSLHDAPHDDPIHALRDRRPARRAPHGTHNLAFIGQVCDMANDVAFTVEYSVRSAQLAVYGLLDLQLKPPGVYKSKFDPRVLLKAFRALYGITM